MKKPFFILTIISGLMFFASIASADNFGDAMKEIKVEKKVLTASWGPFKGPSLYIAVKDDGTNRDGYAQYFCLILNDHNIKGVVIHIMTYENMQNYNTKDDLGRFICD